MMLNNKHLSSSQSKAEKLIIKMRCVHEHDPGVDQLPDLLEVQLLFGLAQLGASFGSICMVSTESFMNIHKV